ncbi:MAG TPA: NADH-quinone oxidoreductase subunit I [bacterium]|nr:NADH-quinone oxidoreductase subunit I [bacterium]
MSYLSNIVSSVKTVFEGMTITFSHLFREPMTIQYPDRTPRPVKETLPQRYRGFLATDMSICTGCTLCQKACPIDCIVIEATKDPEKGRVLTRFGIDLGKCMYCGLCVEPCPTGAIAFTREFEGATPDLKTLQREFIRQGECVVPFKKA